MEAAEAEPAKEVETKSTGEKYTPSKTLIAKYELEEQAWSNHNENR